MVEPSGTAEQHLALPMKRVAFAAPVPQGLVLGARAAFGQRLVRKAHDVKQIAFTPSPHFCQVSKHDKNLSCFDIIFGLLGRIATL